MKVVPGEKPANLHVGQVIEVFLEGSINDIQVPMTVIWIYPDGSFRGKVVWEEA